MDVIGGVIGGAITLLIAAFVLYFFAHSWLIRPLIERMDPYERFPFVERVFDRLNGPSRREMRELRDALDRAVDGDESAMDAWREGR